LIPNALGFQENLEYSIHDESAIMGMVVDEVNQYGHRFYVKTTGSEFNFIDSTLHVSQLLSINRDIVIMRFEKNEKFDLVEKTFDHVVFRSDLFEIAIYRDSTCIIRCADKSRISFEGQFNPRYIGRFRGELLLIDDKGGVGLCSDLNNKDYHIDFECNKNAEWRALY
jgi:hypothetical protein